MSRILFLTPQLPYPPQQGTSLRNWHILRWVAGHHDVTLLSFTEHQLEHVPIQLSELCQAVELVATPARTSWQRMAGLARSSRPDLAQRLQSDDMATTLRRILAADDFDIVQIEGLEMAYLMPTVRAHSRAAIVLDCHNAETELQRRAYRTDVRRASRWPAAAYSRLQLQRLADYERWAMQEADAIVAVSESDAELLHKLSAHSISPIFSVPNSIDVSEYEANFPEPTAGESFDLVFSGKMDYRPNIDAVLWFADTVWSRLRIVYPDLTWGIVGQRPHQQLERLKSITGITVTGKVETVQPYLSAAKIVIMPLRVGSGSRLKLIEAMASRKAIVSTTLGAEGFPVQSDDELLLADTAEEQYTAVARLLDDQELRTRLGIAANKFAQAYDWRVIAPAFEEVYQTALQRRAAN